MRTPVLIAAAAVALGGLVFARAPGVAADAVVKAPAPAVTEPVSGPRETAILAGGCFWGVEGVFEHVKGVESATSGYTGGTAATAHYETVSTGTTRQAESVKLVFDPRQVNYATLLRIYFSVVADPTEVDRQGPDSGPQYRTALFPLTPAQAKVAAAYIAQLRREHVWNRPIATRLEVQHGFFPAEAHHQHFMAEHPDYPYILVNDRPKVEALKRLYPALYRA